MSDGEPDGDGIIRPMNQIAAVTRRQPQGVIAQRIVGAGRDLHRQRIARGGMFLADGFRRIPDGILDFLNHVGEPQRRTPVHLPDAHGVRNDFS